MTGPGPTALLTFPLLALLAGQAAAVLTDSGGLSGWGAALFVPGLLLCVVRRGWGLLALACALAFHWGLGAHQRLLHPRFPASHLNHLAGQKEAVLVEARFYREPEGRGDRSRWYLAAERVWTPRGARRATGNVLVTVRNAYRHWRHGDVVRVPLRLRLPGMGDAGFDYRAFLARRGIHQVAFLHNDWEARRVGRGGGIREWVEAPRRRIRRFVERRFEPAAGGLVNALVLGDRGGLSKELRSRFAAVGMSHVLSISGLHVGMLSYVTFLLLRVLASRSTRLLLSAPVHKLAALASLAPVIAYTLVAGARIPTVRAAIMIGLYHLAVAAGRQANIFGSLALAAVIAALCWPGAVMEVSFQLSFLAVLAIVAGVRVLRRTPVLRPPDALKRGWLQRLRPAFLLSILVPFFATLGTGPVVAQHFGYLSLAGFIANPLLVPLVGFFIVPAGLLMGLLCLLFPAAAVLPAQVLETAVSGFLWAVDLLAALPMASVPLPKPGWPAVGLIYLLIVASAACAARLLRRWS